MLLRYKLCCMPRKLCIMVKTIIRIIELKWLLYVKFVGRRRYVLLLPPLLLCCLVLWPTLWWFTFKLSRALQPLTAESRQCSGNKSLEYYLKHVQILAQPKISSCDTTNEVPVVILVSSSLEHFLQRYALRETWGLYQPTYFVMGVNGNSTLEKLVTHNESRQFKDIIVFDFQDHHQNETLKTALMMKWTLEQCPQAQFMLKIEDDVLVNPWKLDQVLWQNVNAPLVGYSLNHIHLLRRERSNTPRELLDDTSLKYLSGTGYLIRGDYIQIMFQKAQQIPMINQEDVFFTYLVAHKELGLTLTHDKRLSPYKPWLTLACAYWDLASIHGLTPTEMFYAWSKIMSLINNHKNVDGYSLNHIHLLRRERSNTPRELLDDTSLKYLSGTGYLIRGDYIQIMFQKAQQIPMINQEDVFFTYLVAHKELGLTLTHDKRLSPYKPWLTLACAYWDLASIHGLSPTEMFYAWSKIMSLINNHKNVDGICKVFDICFYMVRDHLLY